MCADGLPEHPAFEKQFTPEELGELWGFHSSTIIRWFADEPGVFKRKNQLVLGKKRVHTSLRIPASVAQRVYERHSK